MTTYKVDLSRYITSVFAQEDEALRRIYMETPRQGLPAISVQPEEGRFLQVLAAASGARKAVEIGTLGGYSGTWIARGLAPGGRLVTLEKDPHHAEVARRHFKLAGVEEIVELRLGEAQQLLQALSGEGPFDFVFIDADKQGYIAYFDWSVRNLRPGGVIAAHNALRGGSVAGLAEPDELTATMQEFNRYAAAHPQVISTLYPGGDGTLVAVKKP